jgi:hypothetical protein
LRGGHTLERKANFLWGGYIAKEVMEVYQNEEPEIDEGQPETPSQEFSLSLAQPPPTRPYPRLDRRQGRQDNAAGPSYTIRDPITKEIAGDTRAEMPYLAIDKQITNCFDELWKSIDGRRLSLILN